MKKETPSDVAVIKIFFMDSSLFALDRIMQIRQGGQLQT